MQTFQTVLKCGKKKKKKMLQNTFLHCTWHTLYSNKWVKYGNNFKRLYHAKTQSSENNIIVGRVIHYNNKYMIWITQWLSLCTRHGIIKITSGTVTTELIRMPSLGSYTGTLNGTYYAFLTFHLVCNIAICACN